jgi:hypothetical protein
MKSLYILVAGFFLVAFNQTVSAQWTVYSSSNSPIADNIAVTRISSDPEGDKTHVFTQDTCYHLIEFSRSQGWKTYPEYDAMLDSITIIHDVKARNNVLWCLTSSGLKMYANGTWSHIAYPAGHSAGLNGRLAIDKLNGVWFTGGLANQGISYYSAGGIWTNYTTVTHPEFKLDFGLSDIKLDESANTVWIGTNCINEDAGVYSYNTQSDEFTQYDNGDAKYRCVHGIAPGKNRVFVGTSNFSSMRIMGVDGIFIQSLDQPAMPWTTAMLLDPIDSQAVWATTDRGLLYFKDTLNYVLFTHGNSALDGFTGDLAVEKLTADSARVWITSSQGLYSYAYKNITTGISDPEPELADILIYPNPSGGIFNLDLTSEAGIEITDLAGKPIHIPVSQSSGYTRIDLSGQPGGVYFLTLMAGDRKSVRKLFLTE